MQTRTPLFSQCEHATGRRRAGARPTARTRGHQLPELLVVLLVLAVLAGLAAPGLQAWALNLQLQATLDELSRGLALARTEAIATGRVVEFRYRTLPPGQRVAINRGAILFSPAGTATPATLTLCDRRGTGRALIVARSGRVRTANGQCGFAFAEVLVGLFLLACGSLALAQNILQTRLSVGSTALHAAAMNAVTAATEASRLAGAPSASPEDAAPLFAAWEANFTGGGMSNLTGNTTGSGTGNKSGRDGPRLVLRWQRIPGTAGWQATATSGGLSVTLEAQP